MKVIGLFSGIGGFELGFQRAGFEVMGLCETDPFCQSVLNHRFPGVQMCSDVRMLSLADSPARIYLSQDGKRESTETVAVYGASLSDSSSKAAQNGWSSRTSLTPGGAGCPGCGAISQGSDTPACRFECEPLTWEPPTSVPESSLLPTPTASSYGSCRGGGSGRVGKWRKSLDGLGIKNPEYREWMMGYPIGWTAIELSGTPSSRKSRSSSRKGSKR